MSSQSSGNGKRLEHSGTHSVQSCYGGIDLIVVIGVSGVNSVGYHTSDSNKMSYFLFTSMITDRIGRQDVLLPIYHSHYNFPKA